MADDRLDDAIDAVVRAVDRIERATRASVPEPAAPPIGLGDATRPIQGGVGTTSAFWAPRDGQPAQPSGPGYTPQPQQPTAPQGGPPTGAFTSPPPAPPSGFDHGAGLGAGLGLRPESTAEFSALGAAHVQSFASGDASPQTHELVGRIVGRMQALDDHLAAASQLRREISELVARLAAAAGSPR